MNETKQGDLSRAAGQLEGGAFPRTRLTPGHSPTPHFPNHCGKERSDRALEDRWKVLLLFLRVFCFFSRAPAGLPFAQVSTARQAPQG